ncbi:hypothetical protein FRC03_008306 [Tulasnella sp. 419]|nr:hypothetical protein FRC03_008306 [Tulasnella sp. 419]
MYLRMVLKQQHTDSRNIDSGAAGDYGTLDSKASSASTSSRCQRRWTCKGWSDVCLVYIGYRINEWEIENRGTSLFTRQLYAHNWIWWY